MCVGGRFTADPPIGWEGGATDRERAARLGLLAAFRNLRLQLAAVLPIIEHAKTVRALDAFERLLDCPDLQAHIGRSRMASSHSAALIDADHLERLLRRLGEVQTRNGEQ